ncbi:Uncharacterised protein [Mycobacteroides abscessus subsp. abscessus]|nr:Uncharacterised protein [Mycobacteroides abscessus subsp. abscessus]
MWFGAVVLNVMASTGDHDTDPRQQSRHRNQHPSHQGESPSVGLGQRHRRQRGNRRADLQHRQVGGAHQRDPMRKVALDQRRDDHVADTHTQQGQTGQHQQSTGGVHGGPRRHPDDGGHYRRQRGAFQSEPLRERRRHQPSNGEHGRGQHPEHTDHRGTEPDLMRDLG